MTKEVLYKQIDTISKEIHILSERIQQTTDSSECLEMVTKMNELRNESYRLRGELMTLIVNKYKQEVEELTEQLASDLMLERTEGF